MVVGVGFAQDSSLQSELEVMHGRATAAICILILSGSDWFVDDHPEFQQWSFSRPY